jgi:hypothetical protein
MSRTFKLWLSARHSMSLFSRKTPYSNLNLSVPLLYRPDDVIAPLFYI